MALRINLAPGGLTYIEEGYGVIYMSERDPLLQEREKTHGSFEQNANISQGLKSHFRSLGNIPESKVHREALDMIALKLSRILSGQADFRDHWDDIAGYAKLAAETCPK